MSRFLFTWELGEGLGHVTVQRPLALALLDRGHEVAVAVRNVRSAATAFAGTGVSFIQCPYQTWQVPPRFRPIQTYAHVLHGSAFNSADGLASLLQAWVNLFELARPDAIIFDHSPTALLAARRCSARRILHGIGFAAPPPTVPLPVLSQVPSPRPEQVERDEQEVLAIANEALRLNDTRPMENLGEIYAEVDLNLLATYPELDHFGPRAGMRYWGVKPPMPAAAPEWPSGPGGRIYAYLKLSRGMDGLLLRLKALGRPTLVFGTWVNAQARAQFESSTLKLVSSPLDIGAVADGCSMAILNGTHGTTAELLLRGVPVLQAPIYVEQAMVAASTASLGAGMMVDLNRADQVGTALERMTSSEAYRSAAMGFAERYRDSPDIGTLEEMTEAVVGLL